jgi:hypothetical protein
MLPHPDWLAARLARAASRSGRPRRPLTIEDIQALQRKHPRWGTRRLAQRLKVSEATVRRRLRKG